MTAAVLLLALLAAGCDDPSTVGTELVGAQGGEPLRVELPLDVDTVGYRDVTGQAPVAQQSRLLAGQTQGDPLGDLSAIGYIDFGFERGSKNIEDRPFDTVELRLSPSYAYGDTSQAATFALYDMTEEWNPQGAPGDTSLADLAEGTPITEFDFAPSDTLVTVEMPDAWVQEHASALKSRDTTFANQFHGFQIKPVSGAAVTGFSAESTLHSDFVETSADSSTLEATYGTTDLLSTLDQPTPQTPPDRLVLQDGTARALQFDFSVPDSLQDASLNQALVIFEVDSVLTTLPSGFSRPTLQRTQVYVIPKDDETTPEDESETPRPFGFQGQAVVPPRNGTRFETNALIDAVQRTLIGDARFASFQLRPFVQTTLQTRFGNQVLPLPSLNSALIRTDDGHEPRLVLTYTPTE